MFVTVAPDHHPCLLQLHSTSMHVCYSCISPADMLNQLQLTCKHICTCEAEAASICYTFPRPAVMSLCSYYTKGLLSTIAPDHQSCLYQLHTISIHVCCSFILSASIYIFQILYFTFAPSHQPLPVTIASNHLPCLSQLHLASSHVC